MRIHRNECQLAITISWQTFLVCVDVGLTVAFIVYFQNSFSWPSPPTREGLENLAFRLKFSRNWQKSEQEADPQISPLHFKCKKSNHPFFPIGSCQSVRFSFSFFKSRARDSTTRFVHRSVGRLVGQSRSSFFMTLFFLLHCSCPNGLVTSNIAPAHPHATSVAVYPALLHKSLGLKSIKHFNI